MTTAENKRVFTDEISPATAQQTGRAVLRLVEKPEASTTLDPMAYVDNIPNPVLQATLRGLRNVGQEVPEL